jgi:hypothetical protein
MHILNWFQKDVNRAPIELHEAQTLHLLVRLVKKIDDRQQVLEEQIKHVIDQNNRIIAALLLPGT